MCDESLYRMGKEVGALEEKVSQVAGGMEEIREEGVEGRKELASQLDEHNHGDLEHALEAAGVMEWIEEDSCWRVVPAVVAIVRPDKMAEPGRRPGEEA